MIDRSVPPTPDDDAALRRSAALDGELSREERANFERDLAADPLLANEWREDQELDQTLRRAFALWTPSARAETDAALVRSVLASPSARTPMGTPATVHWRSALAVAASLAFLLIVFGIPTRTKSLDSSPWTLAFAPAGEAVWVPDGPPRKVPLVGGEVFDAGELTTLDRGARIALPGGGFAYLSGYSTLRFRSDGAELLRGSIWIRSRAPVDVSVVEDDVPVWIRGEGSWLIDLNRKGGSWVGSIGKNPTSLTALDAKRERTLARIREWGSLSLRRGRDVEARPSSEPIRLPYYNSSFAGILDEEAQEEWLWSDVETIADNRIGNIALKHAIEHHGDALGRAVLLRHADPEITAPAKKRFRLAMRETMRTVLRADGEHAAWVLRLFKTTEGAPVEWFEELIPTLSAVTGLDPIPSAEVWREEISPEDRRGYLAKWRAVWEQMTGGG